MIATPSDIGMKVRPAWTGREVQPELQEERDDQQEPGEAGEEHDADDQARRVRAVAQQARGDQRVLARAPLDRGEDGEQREAGGHQAEGPQRPAELTALDQRVDQGQRRGADEATPDRVELDRRARLRLGHEAQRAEQAEHAQRDVDEEDHPPAGAEQVGGDEPAREDRPGDGGQAHDRAEGREGAAHLLGREDGLDHAQTLWDEQRTEAALHHAGGDQEVGRRRQRARDRGQREAGDADRRRRDDDRRRRRAGPRRS